MTTNILTDSQNNITDNTNNWTKYCQIKSITLADPTTKVSSERKYNIYAILLTKISNQMRFYTRVKI